MNLGVTVSKAVEWLTPVVTALSKMVESLWPRVETAMYIAGINFQIVKCLCWFLGCWQLLGIVQGDIKDNRKTSPKIIKWIPIGLTNMLMGGCSE
jgi:hypothetical protein